MNGIARFEQVNMTANSFPSSILEQHPAPDKF
jgi:hypothetical protein